MMFETKTEVKTKVITKIAVAVSVVVIGAFAVNYAAALLSNVSFIACSDSDGGINYSVQGQTVQGSLQKEDQCLDENRVQEFFCDKSRRLTPKEFDCKSIGKQCRQGICADTKISQAVCEKDPVTGKDKGCKCNINENKNQFTVIIKKNGIYNNPETVDLLNKFLTSVKNDFNYSNNFNISYFPGETLQELDDYIEKLYFEKNIGYATYVGDEIDLDGQLSNPSLTADDFDLPNVEDILWETNPDGYSQRVLSAFCRDVAISWILPPISTVNFVPDSKKVTFINEIIRKYTDYHNNAQNILGRYARSYLHIAWDNSFPYGQNLDYWERGFDLDPTYVYNSDSAAVVRELTKRPILLSYFVHGSPTLVGLGYNPDNQTDEFEHLYTTQDEFEKLVMNQISPVLFINPSACGDTALSEQTVDNCCWPQRQMKNGVWAYYGFEKGWWNNAKKDLDRDVSRAIFIGDAVRRNVIQSVFVFGDIMSTMNPQ